jgi:hypothetical protein
LSPIDLLRHGYPDRAPLQLHSGDTNLINLRASSGIGNAGTVAT